MSRVRIGRVGDGPLQAGREAATLAVAGGDARVHYCWLLWTDDAWDDCRWLWGRSWPVLPGLLVRLVFDHRCTTVQVIVMGAVTLPLLVASCCWVGEAVAGWSQRAGRARRLRAQLLDCLQPLRLVIASDLRLWSATRLLSSPTRAPATAHIGADCPWTSDARRTTLEIPNEHRRGRLDSGALATSSGGSSWRRQDDGSD